jgi:hypothetical protein
MEQTTPTFYRPDFLALDPQAMGAHMQTINVEALTPQEQQIYARMKDAWMAVHDPEKAPEQMKQALHGYAEFAGMNLSDPQDLNKLGDMVMFHEKYRGEWQAFEQSKQATPEQATAETKEPAQQPASSPANPKEGEVESTAAQLNQPQPTNPTSLSEAERQDVLLKQQELRERIRLEVMQGQGNVRRSYERALAESGRNRNDPHVQQAYLDATMHHFIATPLEDLSRKIMEIDGFTPEEIEQQRALVTELDKKSQANDKKVDDTLKKVSSVRQPIVAVGSFILSAVAFFGVHKAWKEGTKVRDKKWIRRAVRWGSAIATGMLSSALGRQFLIKPLAKPIEAAAEAEEKNAAEFIGQLAEKQLEVRERQAQQPALQATQPEVSHDIGQENSFTAKHPPKETNRAIEEIVANPTRKNPLEVPPLQTSQLEAAKNRQTMAAEATGPLI